MSEKQSQILIFNAAGELVAIARSIRSAAELTGTCLFTIFFFFLHCSLAIFYFFPPFFKGITAFFPGVRKAIFNPFFPVFPKDSTG